MSKAKVACIRCRKPNSVDAKDWMIPCKNCKNTKEYKEEQKKAKQLSKKRIFGAYTPAVGVDINISDAHKKDIESRFLTPDGDLVKGNKGHKMREAVRKDQAKGIKHEWNLKTK